jgi:hypothetical protein
MLPMKAVRLQLGALLAADATTLAPASNANKIALIIAPFTASENLTAGALTLATDLGMAPIAGVVGSQEVGLDPATQEQVIVIKSPAGGYSWLTSGAWTGARTVYGYALLDNTLATLLAVQPLPTPITVSAPGYLIDVDPVELTFVLSPVS